MRSRRHRLAAALAAVGLVGTAVLAGAGTALAVPAAGVATVRLAGVVSPPAPDANSAQAVPITIPLTVTNTGTTPLYDLAVGSLRSAPITTRSELTSAFQGSAVETSGATKRGPTQSVPGPLAPGASERVDYAVDTSNASDSGICLCFLGVYALDLLVTAADEPGGDSATVARTQTYLPSLLGVTSPVRVGWLWPLLDRPHRLGTGAEFADDDLAASVTAGGRLDRALAVVESIDAADAAHPGIARSMLLLLDPEIIDELATMAGGYTVKASNGTVVPGTGQTAARDWLQRLAAVLPQHDVRMTAPADPDIVGLAAQGIPVQSSPDAASTARITQALGLPTGGLPKHDLAWPVESDLGADAVASIAATGASRVVTSADTDDDGAVASLGSGSARTPALLADPELAADAETAIGLGKDNSNGLQRLVVSAAMTSVLHDADSRFVFVVPDRAVDVAPAAAVRAIEATSSLGTPTSPLVALAATTATARANPLTAQQTPTPAPLGAALTAAAGAARAAATIRAMVESGADGVIGDLSLLVQLTASNGWVADPSPAGRWTATLNARSSALENAVQVVVPATGGYSLASADAPLLLTVSNDLPVNVRIQVDVTAVGRSNGFTAPTTETSVVAAGTRPTIKVPTKVTRSGRFEVAVTLRAASGAPIGAPARITVTSTAVGAVGQIVTYGAGALLVLALLVRGVRRLIVRSRAGSGGTGPDDDTARPDGRPEGQPTVPATPS